MLDGATRQVLTAEQASLVEAIEGNGDDALVAAMSRVVDDLAGRVAAGIERDLRLTCFGIFRPRMPGKF
ncbi:MAG: hypothetical protein ACLQJR_33785 [Stellaceae bacterium]